MWATSQKNMGVTDGIKNILIGKELYISVRYLTKEKEKNSIHKGIRLMKVTHQVFPSNIDK